MRLAGGGFVFSDRIVKYSYSGKVALYSELSETERMNAIKYEEPLNTHNHGREYHHQVSKIGLEIGMKYAYMNTIIGKLFGENYSFSDKVLALSTRALYAFVINNADVLRRVCREAMAAQLQQTVMSDNRISEKTFMFPQSAMFTYDTASKVQTESGKNVYI